MEYFKHVKIPIVLAIVGMASATNAYNLLGSSWENGEMKLVFDLPGSSKDGIPWNQAFDDAANRWNDSSNHISISTERGVIEDYCARPDDGVVAIAFSPTKCGLDFGGSWGYATWGTATDPVTGRRYMVSTHIQIRDDLVQGEKKLTYHGLMPLFQHEIGHIIGFGHHPSGSSIMYSAPGAQYPTEDDILGLETLYPDVALDRVSGISEWDAKIKTKADAEAKAKAEAEAKAKAKAKVEAEAQAKLEAEYGSNVAFSQQTEQSSLGSGGPSSNAVDGNANGDYSKDSVTHTKMDDNAWWEVVLSDKSDVRLIHLYNRVDCCASRLRSFTVFVSEKPFGNATYSDLKNDSSIWAYHHFGVARDKTVIPVGSVGRYVRVQLDHRDYLSLAEVQVYAFPWDAEDEARAEAAAKAEAEAKAKAEADALAAAEAMFGKNLAVEKETNQSSEVAGGASSRAVDGNVNGAFSSNSVTHTGNDNNAWWEVALENNADVTKVELYNRTDCCQSRLRNFTVFVSEKPFGNATYDELKNDSTIWHSHHEGEAGEKTIIPIGSAGTVGRYVRVQLGQREHLSLAEVKVFGFPWSVEKEEAVKAEADAKAKVEAETKAKAEADAIALEEATFGTNLAVSRKTNQSSEVAGGVSSRAVDGNIDGSFASNSVTHTGGDDNAWWEVVLNNNADITLINLYNRTDCCLSRLSDFTVFVSEQPFGNARYDELKNDSTIWQFHHVGVAGEETVIPVDLGTVGRYVRVQLDHREHLSLAEVQVFGFPWSIEKEQAVKAAADAKAKAEADAIAEAKADAKAKAEAMFGKNLAVAKETNQSSEVAGGVSSRAVDGDVNGSFASNSVTHTGNDDNAWWEVALDENVDINLINLYNRTDCCITRLRDFTVFVSEQPFGNATYSELKNDSAIWQSHYAGIAGEKTVISVGNVGRYVRVQLDHREHLSLAEVQVIGFTLGVGEGSKVAAEAKAEADAKAKVEADAIAKAEADAKAKAEADAKAKAEADAKAKAETDAKAKAEADAKAKAEADAIAKAEADAIAKAEADAKAKAEADAKAKAEADAKAKAEAEADAKAKAEADAKAKAEADAKAKAEADAIAKAEADAIAKAEADAKAKAEADAKAKAEADAKAKAEADAKAKAEADAIAKAEADAKAKAEADAKAKAEADAIAKAEADAKAKAEADAIAKAEADAKAKAEADAKAKAEADAKAKAEADAIAKAEADAIAKAEADAIAKAEADAKAKAEADAIAKAEADAIAKAEADAIAKAEADAKAKAEADAIAKAEADAKAKAEADAKAKAEADAKAKAEADAIAKAEAEAEAEADAIAKAEAEITNLEFKFYTKWTAGNLETLQDGDIVSGISPISGFLVDRWEDTIPYGVIIDGKLYKYFNSRLNTVNRPDVAEKFPNYSHPMSSGFKIDVDWSQFSLGEHSVEVVIETWDGNITMKRTVVVR